VEIECGLPLYFKHKSFQEVVDYPPFEHVEIVDHPPLVKVFYLHISLAMSILREKIVSSMEEVIVAFKHIQQKNQSFRESITHLQGNQTLTTFGNNLKEPRINLPDKFDSTRSKFRGFVNQVHFTIQRHQHCYSNDRTQVGFIGTLLSDTTLTWFAPFLECQCLLLNNFETFLKNLVFFLAIQTKNV
jgi:hypothetical protein